MASRISLGLLMLITSPAAVFADAKSPVLFECRKYLTGQFYVSDQILVEGRTLKITVAPIVNDSSIGKLTASIRATIGKSDMGLNENCTLTREDRFTRHLTWTPPKNGMYRLTAELTHEGGAAPIQAQLTVPVVVSGRRPDFVWYNNSGVEHLRWPTVFTHTHKDFIKPFKVRGIVCLRYAGIPAVPKDPSTWSARVDRVAREWAAFAETNEVGYDGRGVDEFGGWPGTQKERWCYGLLRAMAKHREAFQQGSVIAAWNAGGMRDGWLELYRQTVDYLLLETYVFGRPFTNKYEWIDSKLDPIRTAKAFVPRWWGERCRTLIALDTRTNYAKSPEREGVDGPLYPSEMELVFRHLRRTAPEMPGIAFYNGSGGAKVPLKIRLRNARAADELFCKYFVKPVVTLKTDAVHMGPKDITVTVHNVGAMDSGPVTVAFLVDGRELVRETVKSVPAGFASRNSRATASVAWQPRPGLHEVQARIVSAPGSTLLDMTARKQCTVRAAVGLKAPCLWTEGDKIVVALTNTGLIDSGKVVLAVLDNGRELGRMTVKSVPVSGNRTVVSFPWPAQPGYHRLEARIISAEGTDVIEQLASNEFMVGQRTRRGSG